VAKEVSEDPTSAAAGGDLGFVSRGQLVPEFEQAAFVLKKGELTPEPLRTSFGYHAIRVSEIQEAGKRPLKEAAGQIREKLQQERSEKRAQTRAEEVRATLQRAADFSGAARTQGLDPKEAVLARGEPLPEVGQVPAVEEAIFSLAVGGMSDTLKSQAGYLVLRILDRLPAGIPPLAEIKAEVAEAVKRTKAGAQALERVTALARAVEQGEELLPLAKREGVASGETGFFSRAEPPADKRLPSEVLRAALDLAVGKASQPVKSSQGVFLVKVIERQPPDPAGFEKERAELARQLLERKRAQIWEAWLTSLRAAAKVDLSNRPGSPQ